MPSFRFSRLGFLTHERNKRRFRRNAVASEALESRTLLSTFYVNGDTGNAQNDGSAEAPFRSIQQGVDAASLNPGDDEVLVEPTTVRPYAGTVVIDSYGEVPNPPDGNLVIRGVTGDAADVQIESFSTKFINNADFDVTIADMTLSGGGHGVLNAGGGTTVVDNLQIVNNTGSGVLIVDGDTIIRNSHITDSFQGIWVGPAGDQSSVPRSVTVEDTNLSANRNFGIITHVLTGGVTLTNVTADNNPRAGGNFNGYSDLNISGGSYSSNTNNGIFVHPGSDITLTDVAINGNGRNGIFFDRVANIAISGSSFDDNGYAGIEVNQADGFAVSDTSISRNGRLAAEGFTEGGGVYVRPASAAPISFDNVTVVGNEYDNRGGGIDIYASDSFNEHFFTNVSISDSVISENDSITGSSGSGVRLNGAIHATISGTRLENNRGRFAGGVNFFGRRFDDQPSSINVIETEIVGNTGSGIYVGGEVAATVNNSVVSGNSSSRHGGGIAYIVSGIPENNVLTVTGSTISGNTAFQTGGGIYAYSRNLVQTVIDDSTIDGNLAGGSGGGVMVVSSVGGEQAALTMTDTTVSGNTGHGDAGGLRVFASQPIDITGSTISGNTTNGIGRERAGGVLLEVTHGRLQNVTVSGNSATQATGGVVFKTGSFFDVSNVTVTDNTGFDIGGVFSRVQQNTVLTNTVLAGNTRLRAVDGQFPFDTTDLGGSASSGGGNVIGVTVPRLLIGAQSSDQVGTHDTPIDAVLGPLQDNGGMTLTHLPSLASPVIDAGVAGNNTPSIDQRGESRPSRGGIDSGAVELQNSTPAISATVSAITTPEGGTALNGGLAADADGDALTLTASVGSVILNADGTWSWSLPVDDGPSDSDPTVVITATDGFGAASSVEFALAVTNVNPEAAISGPDNANWNEPTEFVFSASDASGADEAPGFEYRVDWDNDGIVDDVVSGGTSLALSHTFSTTGAQTVSVVTVDKDGGVSSMVTHSVNVVQQVTLSADSSINLNSADKGNKTFQIVINSTANFDARLVDVSTVVWAGAGVYRSQLKDVDKDGDRDLVLKFRLADTDLIDRYHSALAADSSTTRKTFDIALTGKTTTGIDLFGASTLDLFMTGKKLRDLLNSL